MTIKIRCGKCGQVLKAEASQAGKVALCPRCKAKFRIPEGGAFANQRKDVRTVIEECELALNLAKTLTRPQGSPDLRIAYTEASPMLFAQQRRELSPILDLSDGGLSCYLQPDRLPTGCQIGAILNLELDAPIFSQPIHFQAQLRWLRPSDNPAINHAGVSFHQPDGDLITVIAILIRYIVTRAEIWEMEE